MLGRVLAVLLGASCVVMPIIAEAQAYTFRYAKSWGGALEDSFTDVCMDSAGNTYAAGFTSPSSSTRQLLVVKYATNGNVLWSRNNIATLHIGNEPKICLNASGNVIVASANFGELRIDRLDAANGNTLTSNIGPENNCDTYRLIHHTASGNIILTYREERDSSISRLEVRAVNPTSLNQVWNVFASQTPTTRVELAGAADGALYVGREFGALALVDRLDPANGTSIWSTSLPHGFSSVFSFAVLTGTNHPIVTVNDPAASSVKLLNKTTGSVFRTDLMPQGVVTGLTPARSAGYTLRNVFPDTGSFE